jgi:site-specific DNA-methyltransferase (adenine-specific)
MIEPYYDNHGITIYHGDLLEVLPQLAKTSVDCVVTDPPYFLAFMEREWDKGTYSPVHWEAIARVCKPGAMMLAFGGTRTFHRLTCAIEDAGWEIRDCMMWLYGQGMPKSLDISKAIDKAAGAERKVVGKYQPPGMDKPWNLRNAKDNRTVDVFASSRNNLDVTAPATDGARRWQGWGTGLKPAWEPIILAMKPLDGTFVANAERHGVAGLNIDACRIDCRGGHHNGRFPANVLFDDEASQQLDAQSGILKSGLMKSGQRRNKSKGDGGYHGDFPDVATASGTYGDCGGASRFFFCAKSSSRERNAGCEHLGGNDHPCVKPLALMKYLLTLVSTPSGGIILDPFAGSGTTALAARQLGRRCICVELDRHNCDIAVARVEASP